MTITPEINPDTGLTVYAWQVGESGGYAATPEEATNDALRCENGQLKADNARLREACQTAADWLSRSIRIDDREQADDLRQALNPSPKGWQEIEAGHE